MGRKLLVVGRKFEAKVGFGGAQIFWNPLSLTGVEANNLLVITCTSLSRTLKMAMRVSRIRPSEQRFLVLSCNWVTRSRPLARNHRDIGGRKVPSKKME